MTGSTPLGFLNCPLICLAMEKVKVLDFILAVLEPIVLLNKELQPDLVKTTSVKIKTSKLYVFRVYVLPYVYICSVRKL